MIELCFFNVDIIHFLIFIPAKCASAIYIFLFLLH